MAQPIKKIINPWNFFSKELTKLINFITDDIIPQYGITEVTPDIFVYSAMENTDCLLYKALNSYISSTTIMQLHDEIGSKLIKSDGIIGGKVNFSSTMNKLFLDAYTEKSVTESEYITSDHVLLAILHNDLQSIIQNDKIIKNLNTIFDGINLSYSTMVDLSKKVHDVIINDIATIEDDEIENIEETNSAEDIMKESLLYDMGFTEEQISNSKKQKTVTKTEKINYCTNLNALANRGELDEVIGMEKEIKTIFNVLSRRKSNNVIIVGEQGVGKTQCVYGIANNIVEGNVPLQFKNKEVWKFNPAEILAGTIYRGMFEERLVNLVKQFKGRKNAILFIDNIEIIFSTSQGKQNDYDAGGILNELFMNGETQVIATSSYKGYKALYDSNPDIAKHFQKVSIDKPTIDECVNILVGIKKNYERYHNVKYSDEIIYNAVELSNKYITDKCLPSSAIDIIDELGAYKKLQNPDNIQYANLSKEIKEQEELKNTLIKNDEIEKLDDIDEKINELRNKLGKIITNINKRSAQVITMNDLYHIISSHTNIPINKISKVEKEALKNIADVLKSKIIGQDNVVEIITRAIRRNKVGISNHSKPISVLCCGETGVGKTLLAKTLAKEIYGDEKYLVRFDMSEYSDETSVNKLIGTSAGYVGYNEGGLLTEAIKNKKYCVLLLDEIEKAHDKVFNLLLQVLDDGFLTDNMGQKVDFKNTIILLTSNVGAKRANSEKALGFNANEIEFKSGIIKKEMKNKFPPEFLNRLDDIVYFNHLTEDNLKSIIRLELDYLEQRINKIGYSIHYDEKVPEILYNLIKDESEYGARPIHRIIRNEIENKITDLIIDNDYESHLFNVTCEDDKIKIE